MKDLNWDFVTHHLRFVISVFQGLGKQNFYIQIFIYDKSHFYFLFSLGSYQYSTKTIYWGPKEAGSFLLHILFTTTENWTIFFPIILILKWFTISRSKLIENKLGILIFTHQNSVSPSPKTLKTNFQPQKPLRFLFRGPKGDFGGIKHWHSGSIFFIEYIF